MNERMKECYEGHKVISIYEDEEDTGSCFTGYIGAYDDTDVLMQHISRHGLYDGYVVIHRDDILRQNCEGIYEKKIEALYRAKGQAHEDVEFHDDKVLQSALEFAQKKGYVINADLLDTSVSGFVREYDENTICMDVVRPFECVRDGITEIKLDMISSFHIDGIDEQAILTVLQQRERK